MSTTKRIIAKNIYWTSADASLAGANLGRLAARVGLMCRAAREKLLAARLSQKLARSDHPGRQQPGLLAFRQAKSLLEILAEPQFAPLQLLVCPRVEETALPGLLARSEALIKTRNWAKLSQLEPALQKHLRQLERTLYEGHCELIQREKEVLLGAVQKSLSQLNYAVSLSETKRGRVVRGERGDESFYGTISPEAELTVDFAGFHSRTCEQAFHELAGKLRDNGVEIEVKQEDFHGKPEGGALAREVKQESAGLRNPLRPPAAPKRRSARALLLG
jgi:hypothetical protein